MPSNSAKRRPTVAILTYPEAKLLDVAGPLQVFSDARHVGGISYRTVLLSVTGDAPPTDAGVTLACEPADVWRGRQIDTLLVAGGPGAFRASKDPRFLACVSEMAARSRRVGSVCTGAFVLAAAGLLDGRSAVTHWESCSKFAEKYPGIHVDEDRIFVRDGSIWTSAGVTAGIDMTLAMVTEDSGRQVALRLARSLVVFMARPGGQSQFSEVLSRQEHDTGGRFDDLHAWIAANLDRDLRIDALADQAGMSARNFARVYTAETGQTPAKAVEAFRLDAARRYLEETDEPVATIASKTGFVDDERLRRAMQRVLGLPPLAYRQRFGAVST